MPLRLRDFRSVKRRLEVKAESHGITIIDDFAHHPTAIAQTLKARAHALSPAGDCGRCWSLAPIRFAAGYSRTNWRRALRVADEVVLADVFKSEAIPEGERLDPEAVVADLNASGKPARLLATRRRDRGRHCAQTAEGRRGRDPFQWRLRRNLREAARPAANNCTR